MFEEPSILLEKITLFILTLMIDSFSRIDYIYTSRCVLDRVGKCTIGCRVLSDHGNVSVSGASLQPATFTSVENKSVHPEQSSFCCLLGKAN